VEKKRTDKRIQAITEKINGERKKEGEVSRKTK